MRARGFDAESRALVGAPDSLDVRLAEVLPAGALYAVGGRVRDEVRAELAGSPVPLVDRDYLVVGLGLDELLERLQPLGRVDVVGASFAVVKLTHDGVTVDVALARRERSTGPGHRDFAVEGGPQVPLEEDLARRDFRMNMLARRLPGGELVDPYGGLADIRAGRIEILRREAFAEDPLRMLRACQFAARLGFAVGEAALAAMREAAPRVASVSPERVRDELVKLLGAARPSLGLEAMRAGGLVGYVLPELAEGIGVEQNRYHAFDVWAHALATADAAPPEDLALRLAALFHDVGKPRTKDGEHFYRHEIVGAEMTQSRLGSLRFPNETVAEASALVRQHMYAADPEHSDAALRRFIRRVGRERLGRQFALRAADVVGSGLPKRDDRNE
ncbi:MAG: CCA tRNA nucleotidyltransferase, partial [Vulcanimicrobiaceae bacterium]